MNRWASNPQDIYKINYLHDAINLIKSLVHCKTAIKEHQLILAPRRSNGISTVCEKLGYISTQAVILSFKKYGKKD